MAFKFRAASNISLESPERMFLDFSDRQFKGLLTHQGHVLDEYQLNAMAPRTLPSNSRQAAEKRSLAR